jgi:kelch-like protein 2/3
MFPDNKLHAFRPTVGRTSITMLAKRRDDIVLTRARIGHTYLTHAYLLRGEQIPQCVPCNCVLTVKHILINCIDYAHIRQNFYDVPDLKTLFEGVSPPQLLNFLKEIDLFKQF